MTRILAICALVCFLVVGAAVASILARDSVPMASSVDLASRWMTSGGPVANRQGKNDRLPVTLTPDVSESAQTAPAFNDPLRQAFASDSPTLGPQSGVAAPIAIPMQPPAKPKLAVKPPPQKNYALLSDAQIAAIKGRLNLTSSQEPHWPAVESALRAVARKIHETRQANPAAGSPPIDPESAEVQQLKSAAMPLLFQLREDQKREVRSLARIIGLDRVASQI